MAATALLEVFQLDLFADLDAEAARQRAFDEAPSLFGDSASG